MTQRAFDDNGNEVFPVTLNAICPVEHADVARQAVFSYIVQVEKSKVGYDASAVMNVKLGPFGSTEVTHVFCSRFAFTHQVQWSLDEIERLGFAWCGTREFTLSDDAEEIKSMFCVVTADRETLLNHLNLEVKN